MKSAQQNVVGENVNLDTDFISENYDALNINTGAFQIVWTGANAADGTFVVEASVDPLGLNFVPLPTGTITVSTTNGTSMIQLTDASYRWIRVNYSKGGNTAGTWAAYLLLKSLQ